MKYAALLDEIRQKQKELFWQINKDTGPPMSRKMKTMMAIQQYLLHSDISVDGLSNEDLINRLYNDIFQYSVLTDLLDDIWVSKIIITNWNNISIQFSNGQSHKVTGFLSLQQAIETIDRLLAESGLKTGLPFVYGKLKSLDADITVFRPPAIKDGIRCAIEKRIHRVFSERNYLTDGFAAKQELSFLKDALTHGVSILLTGIPKSGKTTFMKYLVDSVPAEMSKEILETGCREIDDSLLINDEMLKTLLFDAHGGGVDILAFNFQTPLAVLASTQVSAVVAQSTAKYPADGIKCLALSLEKHCKCSYEEALRNVCLAFPLIVHLGTRPPGRRYKILNISECLWDSRSVTLNTIWQYVSESISTDKEQPVIEEHHSRVGTISNSILNRMSLLGMEHDKIKQMNLQNKGDDKDA